MKFLEESLVRLNSTAATAEEAIQLAGGLLHKAETIDSSYIDAMIGSYQEHGPYFVLAPFIAIPHARPEDGVHEASVSLVQLKEPVEFGHEQNDPVTLVFGLGASSNEEHLSLLQRLTTILNDKENIEVLKEAQSYQTIKQIIS